MNMTLKDCYTGGKIYFNLGPDSVTFEGSNWFGGSMFYYNAGSASVMISSGAIVDLTGNSNAMPINPGGGITLYGGDYDNRTLIYGSAGSATQLREFSAECVITGSAVTKIGAISGATVSLASSSCQLNFIRSGEETVSTTYMQASESPYVLETQQGAGAVLVRAVED